MNAADQAVTPTTTPTGSDIPATGPYQQQKPWALVVVGAALVATVVIFALAVIFLKDGDDRAGDIVQVTAPAFALIAGLVGGYFGVRAGSLAMTQMGAASQTGPTPSGSQSAGSPAPPGGERATPPQQRPPQGN